MPVVMYPIKLSLYIYIYIYTEYFRIRDTTGKKVIPNVKVSRKYKNKICSHRVPFSRKSSLNIF